MFQFTTGVLKNFSNVNIKFFRINNKIKLLYSSISWIIFNLFLTILPLPPIYLIPPLLLSSNGDSDDDLEDADVVEDNNAPEAVMDDLDLVDRAKNGDEYALNELKE